MMAKNPPQSGPFRLFYHPASSASMRVTLYLRCRGVPVSRVELVSTGLETDHRGIPVFTMPEGDPETEKIGTTDLTAFNPEGRVPILLLPDGRKMTQSGAIVEFIEECLGDEASGRPLLPDDPVRMYLREMGGVERLSREGEVAVAKRIEAGRETMISGIRKSPLTIRAIIEWRDMLLNGEVLLREIIDLYATYGGCVEGNGAVTSKTQNANANTDGH